MAGQRVLVPYIGVRVLSPELESSGGIFASNVFVLHWSKQLQNLIASKRDP
jgi:hypothetical protein